MAHVISWFEIPVTDMERAISFYRTMLNVDMHKSEMGGANYTFFPGDQESIGGALVKMEQYVPSDTGTTVYLNGGDDLSGALSRVESAGGRIMVPKTAIGENMGYFALFLDTEGNKVGLYSSH